MQAKKLPNPLSQRVKGIFIFREDVQGDPKIIKLMATMDCEVLSNRTDRMMVRTSLGNLKAIKESLASTKKSTLTQELDAYVSQIIIGGRA